jgi:hypothetical protein
VICTCTTQLMRRRSSKRTTGSSSSSRTCTSCIWLMNQRITEQSHRLISQRRFKLPPGTLSTCETLQIRDLHLLLAMHRLRRDHRQPKVADVSVALSIRSLQTRHRLIGHRYRLSDSKQSRIPIILSEEESNDIAVLQQ